MPCLPCHGRSLADLVNTLYLKYSAYRAVLSVFRLPQTITSSLISINTPRLVFDYLRVVRYLRTLASVSANRHEVNDSKFTVRMHVLTDFISVLPCTLLHFYSPVSVLSVNRPGLAWL